MLQEEPSDGPLVSAAPEVTTNEARSRLPSRSARRRSGLKSVGEDVSRGLDLEGQETAGRVDEEVHLQPAPAAVEGKLGVEGESPRQRLLGRAVAGEVPASRARSSYDNYADVSTADSLLMSPQSVECRPDPGDA